MTEKRKLEMPTAPPRPLSGESRRPSVPKSNEGPISVTGNAPKSGGHDSHCLPAEAPNATIPAVTELPIAKASPRDVPTTAGLPFDSGPSYKAVVLTFFGIVTLGVVLIVVLNNGMSRDKGAANYQSTVDSGFYVNKREQPRDTEPDRIGATPIPTQPPNPTPPPIAPRPPSVPPDTPVRATPFEASRQQPFTNSLNMMFVPVDSGKVLFCVSPTRLMDYQTYSATQVEIDQTWKRVGGKVPEKAVNYVSWNDAVAFCEWLTKTERVSGYITEDMKYRLPTNAEWSKAARLNDDQVLSEMVGGIWQWCVDSQGKRNRVLRGGNRANGDTHGADTPTLRLAGYGFRVVLEISR